MPRQAFLALAVVVLAVVGVAAMIAFFVARDDATVPRSAGPGTARSAGDTPAVAPGNVVLTYSDERLTRELRELAADIAGPPSPELEAAGQAVLVRQLPNISVPVLALSSTHRLEASGADDPSLRRFVEHWLGRER